MRRPKKPGREHFRPRLLLRKKSNNRSPRLHSPRKELLKPLLIWRKHKRRLPTGRSKLKRPRKRLQKKWLTLRPPRRKERLNSRLLELHLRPNMLLL